MLLVDTREVNGRADRKYLFDQLCARGLDCELRTLSLGDIIWVAKPARHVMMPAPTTNPVIAVPAVGIGGGQSLMARHHLPAGAPLGRVPSLPLPSVAAPASTIGGITGMAPAFGAAQMSASVQVNKPSSTFKYI